ncbi:nucleotidyl transferase AbiEii/AbiGii toxin family protein [Neorhizobium sp. DT-125]|uniref:nucleotidyl transferase AbiEii/AbiGii toxin family protein n=1 Tax=Neorhizobium sp. DT-125 TaxID=3396163 RepID=UPI003F1C7C1C
MDQYGLRTILEFKGQQIKFEIIREARIALSGGMDSDLGVPVLGPEDMFTEKLLANADWCQDRSVAYRDAFDLGMLVEHFGALPAGAVEKAAAAYGADVERKLAWVVNRLRDEAERNAAADALTMQRERASDAISALRREVRRLWPRLEVRA